MDEIQRVLIKQGRKDLAQKYYKIAQEITNLQKAISELSETKRMLRKKMLAASNDALAIAAAKQLAKEYKVKFQDILKTLKPDRNFQGDKYWDAQGNLKTAQWRHDFPLDVDSFEVAKVLDSETEKSAFGHIELRRPNSMPITSEYEIPSRKLRIFYEKLEQYIEKEIKKIKVAAIQKKLEYPLNKKFIIPELENLKSKNIIFDGVFYRIKTKGKEMLISKEENGIHVETYDTSGDIENTMTIPKSKIKISLEKIIERLKLR